MFCVIFLNCKQLIIVQYLIKIYYHSIKYASVYLFIIFLSNAIVQLLYLMLLDYD